jgi:hypothetical protein
MLAKANVDGWRGRGSRRMRGRDCEEVDSKSEVMAIQRQRQVPL